MNLEYIKNTRGLDFIKVGMKVKNTYLNKEGIVKGGNSSGNLDVLFDGENKTANVHPTWEMEYYNKEGELIKAFK